jgi:hypothetical protein
MPFRRLSSIFTKAVMQMFARRSSLLGILFVAAALVSACAGSHGPPTIPVVVQGQPSIGGKARPEAVGSVTGDIVAIDAGGAGSGGFAADQDFAPNTSWEYATSSAIATSGVTNPAPQAIYQSEREGSTISYSIPGLTAGQAYTVRLSFAEIWWKAAGKRVFNVSINGTQVLTNFDVFATTGGSDIAIAESFAATASASGTISIVLTAVTDYAAIDAIEIQSSSTASPTPTASATPTASPVPTASPTHTPSPTPAPTHTASPVPTASASAGGISIDSGGAATGVFAADEDFVSYGTWTTVTTKAIGTAGVAGPAPQAVYQSQRTGGTVSYTIPGLAPGATYGVRLDFAELYWSAAGKRIFNISINNTKVLSNFDIVATAGAAYTAVAESFSATASATGSISIVLTAVTDNATVNGIEITPIAPAPTPTPTSSASVPFNDYTTFGYDNQRDVFNPNSTTITSAALPNIHLGWQSALGGGDYNTQTQPILATEIPGHQGVLFVGGGSGNVYGYDALTGALLWTQKTGQELYSCENGYTAYFGVAGTVAYDPGSKSLYVVGNSNAAIDAAATNTLYHLDGGSGTVLGQVNFAPPVSGWPSLDFSHTAVTLGSNGLAYVGTGATCDISSWRGRVVAVNVPAMTLADTFYPVWNGTTEPWGGGGIWGWGGVSLDFSGNVLTGVGNTDNGSTSHGSIVAPYAAAPEEYSGYGEALVQLSGNLSTVEASNHPIPTGIYSGDSVDLDLNGTPTIFRPSGSLCDPLAALQGKSGSLYLYDTTVIGNGPIAQYQLAPSTFADGFLGGPAYSPVTGLLYAGVSSSNESLYPPGMMAINPGCGTPSVAWHAAFGPDSYAPGSDSSPGTPRSVPAVSAGGVVFIGTMCTSSGNGCSATTATSITRSRGTLRRGPLICCAPAGTSGGALWALDATTGTVLNGGNPLIITGGPIRMPPTIDGDWIFVLDNDGNMYGLTIDPSVPAINTRYRPAHARQREKWVFIGR